MTSFFVGVFGLLVEIIVMLILGIIGLIGSMFS
jgi:hypothetical protein